MGFDKLPSGGNFISHQHTEDTVCFCGAFNRYLFEGSCCRVHGRFPELTGIHFSQTFVTLNAYAVFPACGKSFDLQSALIFRPGIGAVFPFLT